MKIMGMSLRSTATRFCSSRPFRPGREISSSRQLGRRARGRSRNSCAQANVSGCQPSLSIRSSNDSRTETSSSTTNTMGLAVAIGDNPTPGESVPINAIVLSRTNQGGPSFHVKCRIDGIKQSGVAEWLEQTLHRTLFEHLWADGFIFLAGHEHDGDILLANLQFLLKVRAGHSRHKYIEDEAPCLVHTIGSEKL